MFFEIIRGEYLKDPKYIEDGAQDPSSLPRLRLTPVTTVAGRDEHKGATLECGKMMANHSQKSIKQRVTKRQLTSYSGSRSAFSAEQHFPLGLAGTTSGRIRTCKCEYGSRDDNDDE